MSIAVRFANSTSSWSSGISAGDPYTTSITFAVYVSGASGEVSYHWWFGNGATTTNGSPQTYTYQIPSNYTVAVQVVDANGCSEASYAVVNVPQPIPELLGRGAFEVIAVSILLIFTLTSRKLRDRGPKTGPESRER